MAYQNFEYLDEPHPEESLMPKFKKQKKAPKQAPSSNIQFPINMDIVTHMNREVGCEAIEAFEVPKHVAITENIVMPYTVHYRTVKQDVAETFEKNTSAKSVMMISPKSSRKIAYGSMSSDVTENFDQMLQNPQSSSNGRPTPVKKCTNYSTKAGITENFGQMLQNPQSSSDGRPTPVKKSTNYSAKAGVTENLRKVLQNPQSSSGERSTAVKKSTKYSTKAGMTYNLGRMLQNPYSSSDGQPTPVKKSTNYSKDTGVTENFQQMLQNPKLSSDSHPTSVKRSNTVTNSSQPTKQRINNDNEEITLELIFDKLLNIEKTTNNTLGYSIAMKRVVDDLHTNVNDLRQAISSQSTNNDEAIVNLRLPIINQQQLDQVEANFEVYSESLRKQFKSFTCLRVFDLYRYFCDQLLSNVDYYNWTGTRAYNATDGRQPKNASDLQTFQLLLNVGKEKLNEKHEVANHEMARAITAFHAAISARDKRRQVVSL